MEYTWAFFEAFMDAILELTPILLALISLIVANGLAVGRLEGWCVGDSLYHAFINATTVGYGDFCPTTGFSKFLTVLNAFVGLLLTGIVVGAGTFAVQRAYQVAF